MKIKFALLACALFLVIPGDHLVAQESDEAAVWSVVEGQWEAQQRGDQKWIQELLAADFVGWPNDSPAPRDKGSTRMWSNFQSKNWEGRAHELYPLAIVVHGDMAIAHYHYTNAGEDSEGDLQVSNGRYTDVLVRVEGEWKFISWHGGDDPVSD
jgi:ketosteroid isomerase-like protein